MSDTQRKGRAFYGWIIVAVGFLVMFATGPVFYAFGIYLTAMVKDLGTTRGEAAIAVTIMMLVGVVVNPLAGNAIKKYGAKRLMLIGLAVFVVGLVLMSLVRTTWQLWIVLGGIVGLAQVIGGYLPNTTLVNTWFRKLRATAMSLFMLGAGVGTLVFAPLLAQVAKTSSWRNGYLMLAAASAVAFVVALVLVKNRPEDVGQAIDGAAPGAAAGPRAVQAAAGKAAPWTAKEGMRTRAMWLIVVTAVAGLFTHQLISTTQVPHLMDRGFDPLIAAGAIGLMTAVGLVGKLVSALADRIPARYLIASSLALMGIGLFFLLRATALPNVYVYVVVYGLGYGAIFVLVPTILGAYYGAAFPQLYGVLAAIMSLAGALAPIVGNFIFDAVGSYQIPYFIALGLLAVGTLCALLALPPKRSSVQAGLREAGEQAAGVTKPA